MTPIRRITSFLRLLIDGTVVLMLVALLSVAGTVSSAEPPAKKTTDQEKAPVAEIVRETRDVRGWKLHINRELLTTHPQLTEEAVKLLDQQLQEIVDRVPAVAVAELKKVPLYFSTTYQGVRPRAEYHPDAGWLRNNGRDPVMARTVEFTNISQFAAETKRMPNFTLHELAHAYHHRVLPRGFGNRRVAAAYEKAKAAGTYDKVERRFGNGRPNAQERAYALTSPMEYFAETTEAFYSQNDYFPFTREELRRVDTEMHDLLEALWTDPTAGER